MEPSSFVATIDLNLASKIETDLLNKGFDISRPPYTLFQAKAKGVTITLYASGKLMIQGKQKDEIIRYYFEPEILGDFTFTSKAAHHDMTARIGVDEAGKGDFFGPLCIAAVYGDPETIPKLAALGVKDSKTIKDPQILVLAKGISELCPHALVTIYPAKYNELYAQFLNLNNLLAWGHATAIEELCLKTGCRRVTLDQFANENVVLKALALKNKRAQEKLTLDLTQQHKGEADIVIAAASILARAAFVQGIDRLSTKAGLTLPKGASKEVIATGRLLVNRYGPEALKDFAKLHFKTKEEILRA